MTIGDLNNVLLALTNKSLRGNEKEYIWESFKAKQYLEDNPE